MGFFSDFIGSLTGRNERQAGRDAAAGFMRGIEFTKEEIAKSREDTKDLFNLAFQNIQQGLDATLPIPQQTLEAQLRLLGAGTEALSSEGPRNALTRGVATANRLLTGEPDAQQNLRPFAPIQTEERLVFTPTSATPFNVEAPRLANPLLGNS